MDTYEFRFPGSAAALLQASSLNWDSRKGKKRSTLKINGIQVGKSNPNLVIVAWPKRSPETEDVVIPSTNRS